MCGTLSEGWTFWKDGGEECKQQVSLPHVGSTHTSWNGSLLAVLRTSGSAGQIHVRASAKGTADAEAVIRVI